MQQWILKKQKIQPRKISYLLKIIEKPLTFAVKWDIIFLSFYFLSTFFSQLRGFSSTPSLSFFIHFLFHFDHFNFLESFLTILQRTKNIRRHLFIFPDNQNLKYQTFLGVFQVESGWSWVVFIFFRVGTLWKLNSKVNLGESYKMAREISNGNYFTEYFMKFSFSSPVFSNVNVPHHDIARIKFLHQCSL